MAKVDETRGSLSFGAQLRACRLGMGLSLQAMSARVHYSRSHLSKVENGIKRPTEALARRCDVALATGGALAALVPPARVVGPDLVDAADLSSLDDVALISVVGAHGPAFGVVSRQDFNACVPATNWLVTAVPPRRWSDPVVVSGYRGLFDQLRMLGQTVRPAELMPSLIMHTRSLTEMARSAEPIVRDDLFLLAARFAEYTGWMAQECGDNAWTVAWTDRAAELARLGGGDMTAYRLLRLGDLAMHGRQAARTIELSTAAMAKARDPRVRGLAAQRLAHGHALAGARGPCLRALELSGRLLGLSTGQTGVAHPVVGSSTVADHTAMATGWCLFDLGGPGEAAEILSAEVERLPVHAHRARARYGARLARCYAEMGEIEQACATAEPILGSLAFLDSATIRLEVSALETTLRRQYQHAQVRKLMPLLADARPHLPSRGYAF